MEYHNYLYEFDQLLHSDVTIGIFESAFYSPISESENRQCQLGSG